MRIKVSLFSILWLCLFVFTASSCNGSSSGLASQSRPVAVSSIPDDKDFVGEGISPEFPDARNAAYAEVVKKAIIFLIGQNGFDKNREALERNFLTYATSRRYILGEVDKAPAGKERKWLSNSRDANGNLSLRLQAWINLKKLKTDLDALSIAGSPAAAQPTAAAATSPMATPAPAASAAPAEDLSGVDISSLTFLVYFNPKDPAMARDSDQVTYAKWAVDSLNREMAAMSVQTFDLETVEKLASERSLLQEASSGSVGVGLLLAQKVYAELYAEVTPSVSYEGNKAHVILNVKVFVRTTGALIATLEKGGQQYESPTLAASIKASMRDAVKKINTELSTSLKKYVKNGRFYFVRLSGVQNYREASKFTSTVSKMEGVVSITLKSGSREDGVYDYNVQYKGNPTDMVDKLFEILADAPGYQNFDMKEIRGNELTFTLN